MKNYYNKNLSAERLRLVYKLAPPRVKQYLEAEIAHTLKRLNCDDVVLELGCGYGRILERLASKVAIAVGIDTSGASLKAGKVDLQSHSNIMLAQMDAGMLSFADQSFDKVVCIQNGISAFHIEPSILMKESVRVTKRGGLAIFSSYSDKFWEDRLDWFRIQSENGLVGEIDWQKTCRGEIVCKDGFRGITFGPDNLAALVSPLGLSYEICEVDNSSIFCIINV